VGLLLLLVVVLLDSVAHLCEFADRAAWLAVPHFDNLKCLLHRRQPLRVTSITQPPLGELLAGQLARVVDIDLRKH
jgi:hypothetical protein